MHTALRTSIKVVTICGAMAVWAANVGCKTDAIAGPQPTVALGPTTSLENPEGIQLETISTADATELDLVEEMMKHRAMYARYLQALERYYREHGYETKASWARSELYDLRTFVKPYRYIIDSDTPQASIRPSESIPEADRLYEEARKLMIKGGHHDPIFYNEATQKQAMAKFKELVERYPTSDKVASAAYYIAEIYKEYNQERDNILAIEWYKKAIAWDPDLDHPAWSHAAHIYDFRLHEREKALEWYQMVLEKEVGKENGPNGHQFWKNVDVARKRIAELTAEKTRYGPGEAVSEVRPQPTGSPEPGAPGESYEASPRPRQAR